MTSNQAPNIELWTFAENEIHVSDTVLGRGAYGEVRIAQWRGIQIAAKKLHILDAKSILNKTEIATPNSEIVANLIKEIEMLSKLRHPNLVLFLGVACDSQSGTPTTILTELLQGSLYDVLEVHKVKLGLPDILDIALDIANGIEYLHSHQPEIVHRDISSKNILLGGNKAKIADLGQSKVLGASASSRQTGMPGAMAYSAPEVLTGKYTSKIDIFSFGVLLIQMCSSEYPRIERREEQLSLACSAYSMLDPLMRRCLSFQPSDRPPVSEICSTLRTLRLNDRYYPPIRRSSPQSDIGVLARKWMITEIDERCRAVKLNLEQTSRRLAAEEQRWRDEADRSDRAEKNCKELQLTLANTISTMETQKLEIERLTKLKSESDAAVTQTMQRVDALSNEKMTLQDRLTTLEEQTRHKMVEINRLKFTAGESDKDIAMLQKELAAVKVNERRAVDKELELKLHLDMQLEESRELEARLEQALIRWKQEKESVHQENAKSSRLRSQCSELAEKNTRLNLEVERIANRLRLYESLPLPEEIRARMKDMEEDVRTRELAVVHMNNKREEALRELEISNEKLTSMERIITEKDLEISELKNVTVSKEEEKVVIQDRFKLLEGDLLLTRNVCDRLMKENVSLKESQDILRAQLGELEAVLRDESVASNSIARIRQALSSSQQQQQQQQERPEVNRDLNNTATTATAMAVNGDGVEGMDVLDDPDGGATQSSALSSPSRRFTLQDAVSAYVETRSYRESKAIHDNNNDNDNDDMMEERDAERKRTQDRTAKVLVQQAIDHFGPLGLLKLIRDHPQDCYIVWRGARAIRELALRGDDIRTELITARCHDLVADGLLAFPEQSLLQGQCLRTLGTLAFGNDQVRRHCGEKGVLRAVAECMRRHCGDKGNETESVTVQLHACTAVTNLTHNSIDNRSRFVEADGVRALVVVMGLHKYSVKLQRQGCWALLTLAGSDEGARAVSLAGGAAAVMAAMVGHRMDAGVQQFGCWAISNMALGGDDVRLKMQQAGVPE
eukprot:gene9185-19047_t